MVIETKPSFAQFYETRFDDITGIRIGVTQVMTGGRRVQFEDTAGAAMMPSVSSWLAQFVYAVWKAPERAMRPTSQCWGETDGQDYGQDAVHRVP